MHSVASDMQIPLGISNRPLSSGGKANDDKLGGHSLARTVLLAWGEIKEPLVAERNSYRFPWFLLVLQFSEQLGSNAFC